MPSLGEAPPRNSLHRASSALARTNRYRAAGADCRSGGSYAASNQRNRLHLERALREHRCRLPERECGGRRLDGERRSLREPDESELPRHRIRLRHWHIDQQLSDVLDARPRQAALSGTLRGLRAHRLRLGTAQAVATADASSPAADCARSSAGSRPSARRPASPGSQRRAASPLRQGSR